MSSAHWGSLSLRLAPVGRRWMKFNLVGALGTGVQLGTLVLLKSAVHMNYQLATALAVEISVLHNFVWHERYTWPDRALDGWRGRMRSLAAFHLTNGLVSILGNLLLMKLFVGQLRIPYLVANMLAIAMCGLANFVLADRVAFAENQKPFHHRGTERDCRMSRAVLLGVLITALNTASLGQSEIQPPTLGELEQNVVKQFNDTRVKSGLKPLKFRRDLRLRMEACAIEVKGHAVGEVTGRKSWYLTANPAEANTELEQLALQKTEFDHVSVGVWFARTEAYPSGRYWVVVLPEHSAVHEAVWSHFYLTDDFEYQTIFRKSWKASLPKECRTIQ